MDELYYVLENIDVIRGVIGDIRGLLTSFMILAAIPALLNCFFGYKLLKFMVTLGGVAVGTLLGIFIGAASGDEVTMLAAILLLATLCGFIAFKLYKLGIFFQFWLLGTFAFAFMFIAFGGYNMVGFSVVLGLVIGVLALVLHEGFVIVTTGFSGGISAGMSIGMLALRSPVAGLIIGFILAVFGIVVQFQMEKKSSKTVESNTKTADVPVQNNSFVQEAAVSAPLEKPQKEQKESAPLFQKLSSIVPDYCCPKSKLLIEAITLSKDNTNNTYVKVDFNNIGDESLIAIYFKVVGYDITGNLLGEQVYNVIDINVSPNTKFCSDEICLFDNSVRKVSIILTQIVDSKYKVTKFQPEDTILIPELTKIRDHINEDIAELACIKHDEMYLYAPISDGLWVCTCGHIGFNRCSHCGRAADQVLKNTEGDLVCRVSQNISAMISAIDECKTISKLDECQAKMERASELLARNEIYSDLLAECKSALERIGAKKDELIASRNQVKAKITKYMKITAVSAIILVLAVLGIKTVVGLPPNDSRIKSDLKKYVTELDGKYSLQNMEYETSESFNYFYVTAYIEAENKDNADIITRDAISIVYCKKQGAWRYKIDSQSSYDMYYWDIHLNHTVDEDDIFEPLDLNLLFGEQAEGCYYSSSDISQMVDAGMMDIDYQVDYSSLTKEDDGNVYCAKVDLDITYDNSSVSATVENVRFVYSGNCHWDYLNYRNSNGDISDGVTVNMIPIVPLEDAQAQQLVHNTSVDYNGECLSGEFLSFDELHIEYADGCSQADVTEKISWDDGIVLFDGYMTAKFELVGNSWKLSEISLIDCSAITRYVAITESEIVDILNHIIMDNCTQTDNVSNITIVSNTRSVDDTAITTVAATYNSNYENFVLTNYIEVDLSDSVLQGYQFRELKTERISNYELVETINKSITAKYTIKSSDTTPSGVPSTGNATLQIVASNVNKNHLATLAVKIGNLSLNLDGIVDLDAVKITNSIDMKINVDYTLWIKSNADIKFNIKPNIRYENGTISGSIYFDSYAVGVDDFTIVLG